jgi:hypothetical protein
MNLVQQATVCAWCTPPDEDTPEETSHGVCDDHAEQIMIGYYWERLQNTPSYLEQNASEFAEEGWS